MNFRYLFFILFGFLPIHTISAQSEGSFTVEVSSDTVLMGNTISLSYSIKNLDGEFEAPDLADFRIVAGPNVSSQYSSVNGRVTQTSSYTYYLLPREQGIGTIGGAVLEGRDEKIELDPIQIIILDNPHGIEENYGSPFIRKHQNTKQDTLSDKQKQLLQKLKKGKRKKI